MNSLSCKEIHFVKMIISVGYDCCLETDRITSGQKKKVHQMAYNHQSNGW